MASKENRNLISKTKVNVQESNKDSGSEFPVSSWLIFHSYCLEDAVRYLFIYLFYHLPHRKVSLEELFFSNSSDHKAGSHTIKHKDIRLPRFNSRWLSTLLLLEFHSFSLRFWFLLKIMSSWQCFTLTYFYQTFRPLSFWWLDRYI